MHAADLFAWGAQWLDMHVNRRNCFTELSP